MSELPLLAFDVNETLLDIEALAPQFQRIYGDAGVLRAWLLRYVARRSTRATSNDCNRRLHQLDHAGLSQWFERGFSVDDGVRHYKPAPQVYRAVQESLGVAPARLWLIACHTWDILGASAAGWKTAMILRAGNAPLAVGGQPDISGSNLNDIAEKLCQIHI
jgi:2-haloacid dehalogenase